MDLLSNILGGLLAAFAYAAASAGWSFVRRPYFVPFKVENWTAAQKELLSRSGVGGSAENTLWIINYDVPDYEARGSKTVRVRPGWFKREVRAARKEGYAVLMTRPRA